MPDNLTIIVSTNRNDSYSLKVGRIVEEKLKANNVSVFLLSLEELPHDFIFSNFNGKSNPDFQKLINEKIIPSDKFIFIIPEYNGSFPGILKSFIDCIHPKHFNHKNAAVIGVADGHAGALRALDMWTLILNYLKVHVHWNKPKLSDITHHVENGKLNKLYEERIDMLLSDFIKL